MGDVGTEAKPGMVRSEMDQQEAIVKELFAAISEFDIRLAPILTLPDEVNAKDPGVPTSAPALVVELKKNNKALHDMIQYVRSLHRRVQI